VDSQGIKNSIAPYPKTRIFWFNGLNQKEKLDGVFQWFIANEWPYALFWNTGLWY